MILDKSDTSKFYPYHTTADKEYSYIIWSVFGKLDDGTICVHVTNGEIEFEEFKPSTLKYPKMTDRMFGIDMADNHTAIMLTIEMWEKYKNKLIIGSFV